MNGPSESSDLLTFQSKSAFKLGGLFLILVFAEHARVHQRKATRVLVLLAALVFSVAKCVLRQFCVTQWVRPPIVRGAAQNSLRFTVKIRSSAAWMQRQRSDWHFSPSFLILSRRRLGWETRPIYFSSERVSAFWLWACKTSFWLQWQIKSNSDGAIFQLSVLVRAEWILSFFTHREEKVFAH